MIVGDRGVIAQRAKMRGVALEVPEYRGRDYSAQISIKHIPIASGVTPGVLDADNARHVLDLLDFAIDGCMSGESSTRWSPHPCRKV